MLSQEQVSYYSIPVAISSSVTHTHTHSLSLSGLSARAPTSLVRMAAAADTAPPEVVCDAVRPWLYVGNGAAASDWRGCLSRGVTRYLRVGGGPPPPMNRLRPGGGAGGGACVNDDDGEKAAAAASTVDTVVDTMSVEIDDDNDADLLSLLPQCHAFLERSKLDASPAGDDESDGTSSSGTGASGAVLVYCSAGMSRSQAVAASFLMRIEGLSLHEALSQLPQHASPNENFLAQLLLLEKMGGTVNVDSKVFRAFRQKRIARRTLMYGYFDSDDVSDLDYGNVVTETNAGLHRHAAAAGQESVVYRCRKCRRIVASSSNEIGPSPDDNNDENNGADEQGNQSLTIESQIYTEAIAWMREELEKVRIRIYPVHVSHIYVHRPSISMHA